jgi:cation diffusion facilitator family transporter
VNFFIESVNRLRHFQAASFGLAAIVVFLVSAGVKEALAQFSFWAGRRIGSASLKADGWHHRSDAVASALIVGGALYAGSAWWIDGAMGIVVSLLILYATVDILRTSTTALLGEKPSRELEEKLRLLISTQAPAATNFHHLHVHTYGDHRELTFHLDFPPALPLHDAHLLSSRVEWAVREEMGAEATIHIESADRARTNGG